MTTFSVASVNVDGIQVLAQREYTSSSVLQEYETHMKVIQDFMATIFDPPQVGPPDGYNTLPLRVAIEGLRNLAVNGIPGPLDPNNPGGEQKTYYMTIEMNQTLDLLFRTLNAVGVTVPGGTGPITEPPNWYQLWYNLGAGTPFLQNVFTLALSAQHDNVSLQSMVELQYVKQGNDLLGEKMGDLQEALQVTKSSLSLLTNLQNLHNEIAVNNRPPFSAFFNIYQNNPSQFLPLYQTAASAYFGMPLIPELLKDGYKITSQFGFMNYLFNVATGVTFAKVGVNYTLTLPTTQINSLIPPGFLTYYGLTQVPGVTPPFVYTTSTPVSSELFIKHAQFFSGEYMIGPTKYSITVPIFDLINNDATRNLVGGYGLFPVNSTIAFDISGGAVPLFTGSPYFFSSSGNVVFVPVSAIWPSTTDGETLRQHLRDFGSSSQSTVEFTTVQSDVLTGASGLYNVTTIPEAPTEPTIGPGLPKFTDYYSVEYDGPFVVGSTFTGTTKAGEGTSGLQNIMSGVLQLAKGGSLVSGIKELVKYRNMLSAQIAALQLVDASGAGDPNSLQGRLRTVLDDIKRVFITSGGAQITSATSVSAAYNGFKTWMLDNFDAPRGPNSNEAGEFQQNITNAITAGQSLNDTQKENVRQFLFIFEEFYKSASAILQALTQIIERIAQSLGRG